MSTGGVVALIFAIIVIATVAVLVAYSRGKGVAAEKVPQYAQDAAEKLKQQAVDAQAQLDAITAEIEVRRRQLQAALANSDEAKRLAALAALANSWKVP